jgi:hypothetical protein
MIVTHNAKYGKQVFDFDKPVFRGLYFRKRFYSGIEIRAYYFVFTINAAMLPGAVVNCASTN